MTTPISGVKINILNYTPQRGLLFLHPFMYPFFECLLYANHCASYLRHSIEQKRLVWSSDTDIGGGDS